MNKKLLKKLKEKEEKLLDAVYEIQEFLEGTDDAELGSMGNDFCEIMIDFIHSNDTMSLNDIRTFIEEELG